MNERFDRRLRAISAMGPACVMRGGRFGIEKESLRVTPDGFIAATDHPRSLGSALTNRYITTDYSEALLEFVTPPVDTSWEAIQYLCDVHQFTYEHIGDELLWAFSMPCMIRSESDIPLARYGTSNVGRMKTVYRRGLGYRYGRQMQAISGIHFNYSLPKGFWEPYSELEESKAPLRDFISAAYLGLVRNVRRLDWLLLYLFGASPAICKTFFRDGETNLDTLNHGTLYGPYATSLRMSDIGYQNSNQASLRISANSLDEYIAGLVHAVNTPHADYEKIGLKSGSKYLQLNANILQIENEFYSTIRPKRVARSGERPTEALRSRGVEYVELRALDLSPFDPVGINQAQIRFLELFSIYCLLQDSPPIDEPEHAANVANHSLVATSGRRPGLELISGGQSRSLEDWGRAVCADMLALADVIDPDRNGGYHASLEAQLERVRDPGQTPAARLIAELRETGQPMFSYAMDVSESYRAYFREMESDLNRHRDEFVREADDSLRRQQKIEDGDSLSFEEYLEEYFS